MILQLTRRINGGAYSDIFRSEDKQRVFKLFISDNHRTNTCQSLKPDVELIRRTFQSECWAYGLAHQHSYLTKHVPAFYGTVPVVDIIDSNGKSLSNQYLLDFCYSLAFVHGPAEKLSAYLGTSAHVDELARAFNEKGIRYFRDASVFNPNDGETFKVIDFAMEEFEVTSC
jgi:hypothetical protein